eukprot:c17690_g1_i1 orf=668-2557(+)
MPSPLVAPMQRHWWFTNRKIAEKHLGHAKQLMISQDPGDLQSALSHADSALKLCPEWDKALETKAKVLLCSRRFRDVVNMLYDYIPSQKLQTNVNESPIYKEKTKLLSDNMPEGKRKRESFLKSLSIAKVKRKLLAGLSNKLEREQWRYLVLGQACCHLGMMEDAMILLQSGRKAANAAFRKQSSCMREDTFCSDIVGGSESEIVSHLLGNIKFLLRRRAAALAALEAGLYTESVRHFSKIVDGRRGTPQGFVAECYMHRATAYQAAGRLADAIADCNRTLALNPKCLEVLSARASLFEMAKCFAECLQDLERLKMLYEVLLHQKKVSDPASGTYQISAEKDFQGILDYINTKIMATRQRLSNTYMIDYRMILGLPRGCSRADVERAYLLISLKHRPEKAAHFVDRCEIVDGRDVEAVKEEARSSSLRLFRLIQQAYTGVLCILVDEEIQSGKRSVESKTVEARKLAWYQPSEQNSAKQESRECPLFTPEQEHKDETSHDAVELDSPCCRSTCDDEWLTNIWQCDGQITSRQEFIQQESISNSLFRSCMITTLVENKDATSQGKLIEFEDLPGLCSFGTVQEERGIVEPNVYVQVANCGRELANKSWMNTNEWISHHQPHIAAHPLSVT